MITLSRRHFLGAAGFAAASAAMPRFAFAQDARPSITIAVPSLPTRNTLDPMMEQSIVGERMMVPTMWEGLVERDLAGNLGPVGVLASSWNVIDDKIVELKLREGIKFHNGDEMTAEDVAFSYSPERLFGDTQPATGSMLASSGKPPKALTLPAGLPGYSRAIWPSLAGVEIVDRYTVRFHNTVPDATLLGRLSAGSTVGSLRAWNEAESYEAWSRKPVTTAPYKTEEYEPNVKLVLSAFDDYWGGRPPLERITWVEVPESSSRINGLLAGDYDLACDLTPDQFGQVENQSGFEIRGGAVQNIRIVMFDMNNPLIQKPEIRQALSHSIDRQAIVDSLWGGRTIVPNGAQFDSFKATGMYVEGWTNPEYDLSKAKALLDAAGYNGEPINFMISNNYYVNEVATSQILAQMWKAAGINVETPMTDNWGQIIREPTTGMTNWSSGSSWADPMAGIVQNFGPNSFIRPDVYTNQEYSALCDKLGSSVDPDERLATFKRMLEIGEREDPAYTVLHQNAAFIGTRSDLPWKANGTFALDFRPQNWG